VVILNFHIRKLKCKKYPFLLLYRVPNFVSI